MPIPALGAVEAHIYLVSRADQVIWQSRRAARAKDDAGLSKGIVDVVVPPASVPEFDDVAACRIELADNIVEACSGVAVARRQLKQEAAHSIAEDIRNHPEILDESLGTLEFLDVGDESRRL